jgi:hypothetical protein
MADARITYYCSVNRQINPGVHSVNLDPNIRVSRETEIQRGMLHEVRSTSATSTAGRWPKALVVFGLGAI